jgi:hypothetical protein
MKTKALIAIICTIANLQVAQAEQLKLQSHANCTKSEYNPREFTSQDLFFSSEPYKSANCIEDKDRKIELDQQAWDLLKKEYPDTYMQVVPFDLVGDKQEEFIVQGSSPSGGTNFYFLEKKNRKWKVILAISGGFTISGEEITNWSRSGVDETWQTVYSYSKGSYKETSRQAVPLVLLHQKGFIELMMKLNERGVKWN